MDKEQEKRRGRPPKDGRKGDRHKPHKHVRIHLGLAAQAEILVARNATSVSIEVNRALRELLVREGLWPPAGPTGTT